MMLLIMIMFQSLKYDKKEEVFDEDSLFVFTFNPNARQNSRFSNIH